MIWYEWDDTIYVIYIFMRFYVSYKLQTANLKKKTKQSNLGNSDGQYTKNIVLNLSASFSYAYADLHYSGLLDVFVFTYYAILQNTV